MGFRYRFVPYGTDFEARTGIRSASPHAGGADGRMLYENEIAFDVGGVCWGRGGESRQVIDHHFAAKGQFPCASAGVLHLAGHIAAAFARYRDHEHGVWLVAHHSPDFDAFCSAYLARCIIAGTLSVADAPQWVLGPDATVDSLSDSLPASFWFEPALWGGVSPDLRWAMLLAAAAAFVDQSRHLACPRHRSLHSVLYAALRRGRPYEDQANGAFEFFEAARQAIQQEGLNPLVDSVLEHSETFRPELAFLDNEMQAYARDLARSRRSMVAVSVLDEPHGDFFGRVREQPLVDASGALDAAHVWTGRRARVDAIWIRDPDCLLFTEWARHDLESSSLGQGFLFTAVARSGSIKGDAINSTRYWFALDAERAAGRHLYGVWAVLQHAEVSARLQREPAPSAGIPSRTGFEGRAGRLAPYFDDPWYDGNNYASTIIDTPNRGTAIGRSGTRSDLMDDPVARLVIRELELGMFLGPARISDFAAIATRGGEPVEASQPVMVDIRLGETAPPARAGYYRRVEIELRDAESMDEHNGSLSHQVGGTLWDLLEPGEDIPADFESRHLIFGTNEITVWSRRGVATAFVPGRAAEERAADVRERIQHLARIAMGVDQLLVDRGGAAGANTVTEDALATAMDRSAALLIELAREQHYLSRPEGRSLRRFFEALRFEQTVDLLRDLMRESRGQLQRRASTALATQTQSNLATVAAVQLKVEWIEILIITFYAAELTHAMSESLWPTWHTGNVILTVSISLAAGVVAIFALEPWRHKISGFHDSHSGFSRILLAPGALLLILLGWLIVAVLQPAGGHPPPHVPAGPASHAPAAEKPAEKPPGH